MIEIKGNDSVIITPDIVENSNVSIADNVNYHRHINLTYLALDSKDRFQAISKNSLGTIDSTNPSILHINLLIESTIATLLSTSVINDVGTGSMSPHYLKYKAANPKVMPSSSYLDQTSFGHIKVWGGEYGSLSYPLHLLSNTDHYLSPSNIADTCTRYYLSLTKLGSPSWSSLIDLIESLLLSDSLTAPEDLYECSTTIISTYSLLNQVYRALEFLDEWVPKLLTYYLSYLRSVERPDPVEAYLIEVAKLLLINGVGTDKYYLAYSLVHQSLSPFWLDLYNELLELRSRVPSSTSSNESALALLEVWTESLPLPTQVNPRPLSQVSNTVLNYLCPPLGFNGYLVVLALGLLNRAYITTHPSRMSVATVPFVQMTNEGLNLIRPYLISIYKHLYYSGYLLKKSNMKSIRIMGGNLILLSKQALPSMSDIKDLLV